MSRKCFLTLIIVQALIFILFVGAWLYSSHSRNREIEKNRVELDERISKIVVSTLEKVREDVGILAPSQVHEESKKKEIKIEGAQLSTFENHFYINNVPFYKGDVVAPYGMAVAIGRDMVIFNDLNGGTIVLGKIIEEKNQKNEENRLTTGDKFAINKDK